MNYKCISVSSSISNFKEALLGRYPNYQEWYWDDFLEPTIFFGCYHFGDYLKLIWHRGPKKVFWCGSDILALEKSWWRFIVPRLKAMHVCENQREWFSLEALGISAAIHPMYFGKPWCYETSFTPATRPHIFMTTHAGRESEYGLFTLFAIASQLPTYTFHVYGTGWIKPPSYRDLKNVIYHGVVSAAQFDEEIKTYQGTLRLNTFDGFSENVAKALLLGLYPVTWISYPHIDCAKTVDEAVALLKKLKAVKVPNPASEYWRGILTNKVEI